jgi:transcriptional regulator with XRE-family HTH domain
MLDWTQPQLAEAAGVSFETIKRLERLEGEVTATRVATIDAIEKALIKAGIEFTNGDEPGVKLRAKKRR